MEYFIAFSSGYKVTSLDTTQLYLELYFVMVFMIFFQFQATIIVKQKNVFSEATVVKPSCLQENKHLISKTPSQDLQFTKPSGVGTKTGNSGSKMSPH